MILPEDNSVRLGTWSCGGDSPVTHRPQKEARRGEDNTSHQGTSAKDRETGGLPSPESPISRPSAQRGRIFKQLIPKFVGILTAGSRGHSDLSSWIRLASMGSFLHLTQCPDKQLDQTAVLATAIWRILIHSTFSGNLPELLGTGKRVVGRQVGGYQHLCDLACNLIARWVTHQCKEKQFLASSLYIYICASCREHGVGGWMGEQAQQLRKKRGLQPYSGQEG